MKKKPSVLNHVLSHIHVTNVEFELDNDKVECAGRAIRFDWKKRRYRVAGVCSGDSLLVERVVRSRGILSSDKWAEKLDTLLHQNFKGVTMYPIILSPVDKR